MLTVPSPLLLLRLGSAELLDDSGPSTATAAVVVMVVHSADPLVGSWLLLEGLGGFAGDVLFFLGAEAAASSLAAGEH